MMSFSGGGLINNVKSLDFFVSKISGFAPSGTTAVNASAEEIVLEKDILLEPMEGVLRPEDMDVRAVAAMAFSAAV